MTGEENNRYTWWRRMQAVTVDDERWQPTFDDDEWHMRLQDLTGHEKYQNASYDMISYSYKIYLNILCFQVLNICYCIEM